MLTVIAEIRVHSGEQHKSKVVHAFEKIIPTILAEHGCQSYKILVDANVDASYQVQDPNLIFTIEQWESIEDLNAHLQTEHIKAAQKEVKDDVVDMKIRILEHTFSF